MAPPLSNRFPGIPISLPGWQAPEVPVSSRPSLHHGAHLEDSVREIKRVTNHLKDHFGYVPIWEFEKVVGKGTGAVAYLVKDKRPIANPALRRVVIKRGTSDRGDEELRIEMAWLELVRGAEHICTMLACRDDKEIPTTSQTRSGLPFTKRVFSKYGNVRRRLRKVFRRTTIDDELQLRELAPWPLIVLEYMPYGTLQKLVDRARKYNVPIPNRVLWSFFLCLVRACIGMAYHKALPEGAMSRTEEIPPGENQQSLVHGSINLSNIMIGNPFAKWGEHSLGPIIKLIDLGMAATAMDGQGVRYNLWDVSGIIMALATLDVGWAISPRSNYRGFATHATPILGAAGRARYPMIDDDLRDLLARCLADNPLHRPGLRDMVAELENRVAQKKAASFPFNIRPQEEDAAIGRFLRRCIYDAEEQPDPEGPPNLQFPNIESTGPAPPAPQIPQGPFAPPATIPGLEPALGPPGGQPPGGPPPGGPPPTFGQSRPRPPPAPRPGNAHISSGVIRRLGFDRSGGEGVRPPD